MPNPSPLQRISGSLGAGFGQLRSAGWAKPFRSVGVLLLGRGAQALMSLVYVALAARALGPQGFGVLVLIHSLVLAVGEVAKFQSWQVVLHYGAEPLHAGNGGDLKRVFRFAVLLDGIGLVLGLAVAILGAAHFSGIFGVPPDMQTAAIIYSLSVVFIVAMDMPSGLLRLYGRFDLLSLQSAAMPLVRMLGAIVLFISGGGLYGFLTVWFAATTVGTIVMLAFAIIEARRRGLFAPKQGEEPEATFRANKAVWRFSVYSGLSSSLQLAQSHLATLAVGWLLGPAAAGLFRIAAQVSSVLVKPLRQLFLPSILPELAHLKAAGQHDERNVMVRRVSILTGLVATALLALLIVIGKPVIAAFAGKEFVGAYGVMVALTVGATINAWAVALEPLLISEGRVRFIAAMRTVTTLLYLALLYGATVEYGLMGAGYAAIFQTALISLIFFIRVRGLGRTASAP